MASSSVTVVSESPFLLREPPSAAELEKLSCTCEGIYQSLENCVNRLMPGRRAYENTQCPYKTIAMERKESLLPDFYTVLEDCREFAHGDKARGEKRYKNITHGQIEDAYSILANKKKRIAHEISARKDKCYCTSAWQRLDDRQQSLLYCNQNITHRVPEPSNPKYKATDLHDCPRHSQYFSHDMDTASTRTETGTKNGTETDSDSDTETNADKSDQLIKDVRSAARDLWQIYDTGLWEQIEPVSKHFWRSA